MLQLQRCRLSRTWLKALRSWINSQMQVNKIRGSRAIAATVSIIKKVKTMISFETHNHQSSQKSIRNLKVNQNRTKQSGITIALTFSKLHTLILTKKKKRKNNIKASSQCQQNICNLANYSRLFKSHRKRRERNRNNQNRLSSQISNSSKNSMNKCQVKIKLPPTQINLKNQLPL